MTARPGCSGEVRVVVEPGCPGDGVIVTIECAWTSCPFEEIQPGLEVTREDLRAAQWLHDTEAAR